MENTQDDDDYDVGLSLPMTPNQVAAAPKSGKVVDLTNSDVDIEEAISSDDEIEVEAVVPGPMHLQYRQQQQPYQDNGVMKRQLPVNWSQDPNKRPNLSTTYQSYGQEFTFSVLSKTIVEAKWTGMARMSDQLIGLIKDYIHRFQRPGSTFFKQLKSDSQNKLRFGMVFPLYERFENQLSLINIPTVSIPKNVIQAVSMGRADASTITTVDEDVLEYLEEKLPPLLFQALADFQKVGVHWGGYIKRGRCLIADEPGLGKTIQSIGCAWIYKSEWPLLVISPSSARYHWQAEIVKWCHGEKGHIREEDVQVLTSGSQRIRPDIEVLIVSYDLADRIQDKLNEQNDGDGFQVIIADECHMLKNKNTKRAKAILPMLRNATRAILLSGTPALSRPKELWSQLNVIDKAQWPSYEQFVKRYCTGTAVDANSTKGASNIHELHLLLRENCMIRRLKSEILKSLPPKTRRRVEVEIEDDGLRETIKADFIEFLSRSGEAALLAKKKSRLMQIAEKYLLERNSSSQNSLSKDSSFNGKVVAAVSPSKASSSSSSFDNHGAASESGEGDARELAQQRKSLLMGLYKNTGIGKLPAIVKHIQDLLNNPAAPKFLVFAHHHAVLDYLQQTVFRSVSIIRIDGKTQAKERQNQINKFQDNRTVRAALLGITAAGVAITLTAASRAIFTELFWTPAALLQAEDRCHRIGQTAPVQIDYIVARNSVDDILWPLVEEKMRVLGEIVEGRKDTHMFEKEESDQVAEEEEDDDVVAELAKEDVDRSGEKDPDNADNGDGDNGDTATVDPLLKAMDEQKRTQTEESMFDTWDPKFDLLPAFTPSPVATAAASSFSSSSSSLSPGLQQKAYTLPNFGSGGGGGFSMQELQMQKLQQSLNLGRSASLEPVRATSMNQSAPPPTQEQLRQAQILQMQQMQQLQFAKLQQQQQRQQQQRQHQQYQQQQQQNQPPAQRQQNVEEIDSSSDDDDIAAAIPEAHVDEPSKVTVTNTLAPSESVPPSENTDTSVSNASGGQEDMSNKRSNDEEANSFVDGLLLDDFYNAAGNGGVADDEEDPFAL